MTGQTTESGLLPIVVVGAGPVGLVAAAHRATPRPPCRRPRGRAGGPTSPREPPPCTSIANRSTSSSASLQA